MSQQQLCVERAATSEPAGSNVLMIYPRFTMPTFWNLTEACKLSGARYPNAPLGLITVAAMLPPHWRVRLVDLNIEEATDADFMWADMVMTGGMIPQQIDTLRVIKLAHQNGKPVVVGGPAATSSPHIYHEADFRVLGEVEDVLPQFIAAWDGGERRGDFTAAKFQIDVTKTPAPRFDLLKLEHYMYPGVQFSRGCPFTCEFCDIIELYGRVPRTKTTPQMLAELQSLYDIGYRGHVDFVDDNLIGNRKSLRAFLPQLIAWQQARHYPFEFSTEASINLADDAELLELMRAANFFSIFIGIESPDPETLAHAKKKQNTRRNLAASVHKLYGAGIYVTAGFIIGFDSEKTAIADAMVELIQEAAIPVAMVGLLSAFPNTQLTRRLEKEGRLHADFDRVFERIDDHCTHGLNFDSLRPERDILLDYRNVLARVYDPAAYAERLERVSAMLDCTGRPTELPEGDKRRRLMSLDVVHRIVSKVPEAREAFWDVFKKTRLANPKAARHILAMAAIYAHVGPFAHYVIAEIDRRIEAIDAAAASADVRSAAAAMAPLSASLEDRHQSSLAS